LSVVEFNHVVIAIDRIMRADYDCPVLVKVSPYTSEVGINADMIDLKISIRKQLNLYGDFYRLSISHDGRKIYITKRSPNDD
jgi:hypothetical protein